MISETKRAYMKSYREKNKVRIALQSRIANQSRYYENHEATKASRRLNYATRGDEIRESRRLNRIKNREKTKLISRRFAETHKEHLAKYHHKWWSENREKIRAKRSRKYKEDPAKHIAKALKWATENKAARVAILAKRRATKLGAQIGTDRDAYRDFVNAVKNVSRITCYWCNSPVPKSKRHIDHVIPLSRGGKDDVHNLCCACDSCNCSKGNKLPEEFSGQLVIPFC